MEVGVLSLGKTAQAVERRTWQCHSRVCFRNIFQMLVLTNGAMDYRTTAPFAGAEKDEASVAWMSQAQMPAQRRQATDVVVTLRPPSTSTTYVLLLGAAPQLS